MISLFIALAGAAAITAAIVYDDPTEGERLLAALQKLSLYGLDEIKLVGDKLSVSKFIASTNSWMHAEFESGKLLEAVLDCLEHLRKNAKAWIEREGYTIEQELKKVL